MRAGFALFTVGKERNFVPWKVINIFRSVMFDNTHLQYHLEWISCVFKITNPLAKLQENPISLLFKENIPHLAHGLALRTFIVASDERLKSLFVRQSIAERIVFGQYTFPISFILLLSYRERSHIALHVVIALNWFTIVCNVNWFL